MKFQHIRHATHQLDYNGRTILVDPVFSPAGTMKAIPGAFNSAYNPLTELPVHVEDLCNSDLLLVTHLHSDHFDSAASTLLSKDMPVVCSPYDKSVLAEKGFKNCTSTDGTITVEGIEIIRTGGTHGTGPSATALNPVSGYILKVSGEPTVYITGDTVWCQEVENVLTTHQPDIIICYGGAALYEGDIITMGIPDFEHIRFTCPESKLIIIHTEGWNHCGLSRKEVRQWTVDTQQEPVVWVPEVGEHIQFE